jgi:hypothetical protein
VQNSVKPAPTLDAVMVIASLAFVCVSPLPLVRGSFDSSLGSWSIDAWHSYASSGMLLAIAAMTLWVGARLKVPLASARNPAVLVAAMILLGTALVFVRGVVFVSENPVIAGQITVNVRLGYGAFLMLGLGVTAAVCAAWRPLAYPSQHDPDCPNGAVSRDHSETARVSATNGRRSPASASPRPGHEQQSRRYAPVRAKTEVLGEVDTRLALAFAALGGRRLTWR